MTKGVITRGRQSATGDSLLTDDRDADPFDTILADMVFGPAGIALEHRTSHHNPQGHERPRRGPQIFVARLNNRNVRLYDSMQVPTIRFRLPSFGVGGGQPLPQPVPTERMTIM